MHGSEKGQQVGTKAFRCGYKGCGRQYTTAHHLKVKQLTCSQTVCKPNRPPDSNARSECAFTKEQGNAPGRRSNAPGDVRVSFGRITLQ